jgi:hypothetical protein
MDQYVMYHDSPCRDSFIEYKLSLTLSSAWSGALSIDDFIKVSIEGRANGDFIAHCECGTLANVNLQRAVALER